MAFSNKYVKEEIMRNKTNGLTNAQWTNQPEKLTFVELLSLLILYTFQMMLYEFETYQKLYPIDIFYNYLS